MFYLDNLKTSDFNALRDLIPSVDYPWFYGRNVPLSALVYVVAAEVLNHVRKDTLFYALRAQETDDLMGCIVLIPDVADKQCAEIGYFIKPEYRQQGIMSDAVHAVVGKALDRGWLRQLHATVHPDNLASRAILERLGLTCVKVCNTSCYTERDGKTGAPRLFYEGARDDLVRARLNNMRAKTEPCPRNKERQNIP